MSELASIIQGFIDQKREWTYWDFKQAWHKNKIDLLHDIICLANAEHSGSRFLIIGVTDPEECAFVDVSQDPNRKRQADLLDFLRKQPFAGDSRPSIRLHTIPFLENKFTDVIEIENEPNKPFTLSAMVEFQGVRLSAGSVYTRVGDKNTAKDSTADISHVERMWRARFGLDLNPLQRMLLYLPDVKSWKWDGVDSAYHLQNPEFTIREGKIVVLEASNWWGAWPWDEPLHEVNWQLSYHQTILEQVQVIHCNRESIQFPNPDVGYVTQGNDQSIRSAANTYCLYHYMKG